MQTRGHIQHFRRPRERTFTQDQRPHTTILLGGLSPRHDRLVAASVRGLGYRCRALPNVSRESYEIAREFGNNGFCNPNYFTVGNLVKYVLDREAAGMSRREIIDSHVFLTASSCGTCRFGMYESEYRLALSNAGFDGFRILVFGTDDGIDQSTGQKAGLDMNLDFFLGLINAFNFADVLNQFHYQIRGYEVELGSVDAATEDALVHLEHFLETRAPDEPTASRARGLAGTPLESKVTFLEKILHQLLDDEGVRAMEAVRHRYDEVELDPFQVKPVVKIIGEFWAQNTEGDGNFNIHRFLEDEGAEVFVVRALFTRLMYLLHMHKQAAKDRKGLTDGRSRLGHYYAYYRKRALLTLAERILQRENRRLLEAMGGVQHELADQYELARLAEPYWNWRTCSGESHLEVAENIYYHTHDLCHMVLSVKPFGCMPSTQSDGVQIRVVEDHHGMTFIPIETSGDSEVIAHSRIQMALGGARQRARKEFADVLDGCRWSLGDMRAYAADHPRLRRPSYRIPHTPGVVGRAANLALHVNELLEARPAVASGGIT
ncbi:MAG: activator of (R)-2-hydroxyglutaryl-CoA dehydratase [Gemmatimonadota bacterium]|nr:activator of (R)-2-hydroxyglutaryl-CoA dehydratase [Gemmatimonadota bacterium]